MHFITGRVTANSHPRFTLPLDFDFSASFPLFSLSHLIREHVQAMECADIKLVYDTPSTVRGLQPFP